MEETEPLEAAAGEVAAASDGPPAAAGAAPLLPSDGSSSMVPRIRQVRHARSSSFQRWRSQMLRAWRWGPGSGGSGLAGGGGGREQSLKAMVNFEMMVNQKRQWYQIKAKARVLHVLLLLFACFFCLTAPFLLF